MADEATDCDCKIGRVADAYDLVSLDRDLALRHDDGESLRSLETLVNVRILESALRGAGADVLGDLETVYERLTDEDADPGRRMDLRTTLERRDLDPAALESDFVSYATVRRHLRDCLDRETGRGASITAEDAIDTVEWARARSAAVVRETLERLGAADEVAVADPTVTQSVKVTCRGCGLTTGVVDLIERGGCDCPDDRAE